MTTHRYHCATTLLVTLTVASNACFASSPELSPNAVDATIIHSLFNIGLFTTATIAVGFTLSSMDKMNQSKRK
ncbi:Uncharacterised protein [BD1-7 clade bacterium]|uniref:Uncharacterized protein n=1 Tax=BD1-7 clade bacterium TaxID=2029982 RepID=A0A5S9Q750_9GAMM|nr:Uncharacterised protein [BD1-7 clade bacterium]